MRKGCLALLDNKCAKARGDHATSNQRLEIALPGFEPGALEWDLTTETSSSIKPISDSWDSIGDDR